MGVPVISYAKTKDFPGFFSPHSGFQVGLGSSVHDGAFIYFHRHLGEPMIQKLLRVCCVRQALISGPFIFS